jgi:hypothetical protein
MKTIISSTSALAQLRDTEDSFFFAPVIGGDAVYYAVPPKSLAATRETRS